MRPDGHSQASMKAVCVARQLSEGAALDGHVPIGRLALHFAWRERERGGGWWCASGPCWLLKTGRAGRGPGLALSHSETLGEDRLMLCKLVCLPGVAR